MRNPLAVVLALSFLVLAPESPCAFPNEPTGFRSMKWGDPLEKVSAGMTMVDRLTSHGDKFEREKVYKKKDDKLDIAGVPVVFVQYGFYKDRLVSVTALVPVVDDGAKLLEMARTRYGPETTKPSQQHLLEGKRTVSYSWKGEESTVYLTKNPTGTWLYWLYSTKLDAERNKDSFAFREERKEEGK